MVARFSHLFTHKTLRTQSALRHKTQGNSSMADQHYQWQGETSNVSGRSMAYASLAGVALTAPLLGMMGFSFLATLTLLAVTSPLLLIFSPLLLCFGFLFAGVLAGFAVTAAMAFAGVSALAWMYREIKGSSIGCGVTERLAAFGGGVKEQETDWGGYLQQKWQQEQQNSPDNPTNTIRG